MSDEEKFEKWLFDFNAGESTTGKRLYVKSEMKAAWQAATLAVRERAAAIVDAECARILSKQTGTKEDFGCSVDTNIRMIACVLPDIAEAIRRDGE